MNSSRGKREGGRGKIKSYVSRYIYILTNQMMLPYLNYYQSHNQPVNDGFSHVDQVIMTIMTVNDSSNKGINPKVIQELLVGGGHPILIIDKHHK